MAQRVFEPGQVVLVDVEDVRESVRIVEVLKASARFPGADRLYVELLDGGDRAIVSSAAVERPCSGSPRCVTIEDRCRHCGEHIADPHMPGCPHDVVDECEGAPPGDEEESEVVDNR